MVVADVAAVGDPFLEAREHVLVVPAVVRRPNLTATERSMTGG